MMKNLKFARIPTLMIMSAMSLADPVTWSDPITGMTFVAIPKGCFQMGTNDADMAGESSYLQNSIANIIADEQPKHEVCVDVFWLGQFEVRASDWEKVMQAPPPSGRDGEPAGNISFKEAQAFAKRLTLLSKGQFQFRLPTEAEWEYACQANKAFEGLPFHSNRVDFAWYSTKNHQVLQPAEVGQLKANAWGLYDMLGNVWEWVADSYQVDGYRHHSLYTPLVNETHNNERVIRGASHRSDYIQLRCANRSSFPADEGLTQIGLRLVREP